MVGLSPHSPERRGVLVLVVADGLPAVDAFPLRHHGVLRVTGGLVPPRTRRNGCRPSRRAAPRPRGRPARGCAPRQGARGADRGTSRPASASGLAPCSGSAVIPMERSIWRSATSSRPRRRRPCAGPGRSRAAARSPGRSPPRRPRRTLRRRRGARGRPSATTAWRCRRAAPRYGRRHRRREQPGEQPGRAVDVRREAERREPSGSIPTTSVAAAAPANGP